MPSSLRVFHTSDWHLGRMLYNKKRYGEFESFLNWLAAELKKRQIDILLIAGDVFDTTTPTIRAQELYYRFLCGIAKSSCRHVVITAGNHDSPAFLDAPRPLLKFLNIHVVGLPSPENPADEVLVLSDKNGAPELIVAATPFLRGRDMRKADFGESIEDKEEKLAAGIREHYSAVAAVVESVRAEHGQHIPAICMGHLYTDGAKTMNGDGVRNLHIGSLAHITADIFSPIFDYVALGHLHVPQIVGDNEYIRYSGSPIPMGFNEASQKKMICQMEFSDRDLGLRTVEIPTFQKLRTLKGNEEALAAMITELAAAAAGESIWLEVIHTGDGSAENIRIRLEKLLENTNMEILRFRDERILNSILSDTRARETLQDLDEEEVFRKLLEAENIAPERRTRLMATYREALASYLMPEDEEKHI